MADVPWDPFKLTSIVAGIVATTALATGLVVANWGRSDGMPPPAAVLSNPTSDAAKPVARTQKSASASPGTVQGAPSRQVATTPSPADVEACNQYATSVQRSATTEVLTDALVGGALGAGVGAAGGAIAGGAKTAGKGAAIGSILGATAGTLYGLNESKGHDAQYVEAYRTCMRRRGYSS